MNSFINIKRIVKEAAHKKITANELDILVSKTRELTLIREQELNELRRTLEDLERRVAQ